MKNMCNKLGCACHVATVKKRRTKYDVFSYYILEIFLKWNLLELLCCAVITLQYCSIGGPAGE
jgi:hypothetical protein